MTAVIFYREVMSHIIFKFQIFRLICKEGIGYWDALVLRLGYSHCEKRNNQTRNFMVFIKVVVLVCECNTGMMAD